MELEFETRTTDYLRQSIEGVCRQEQTLEVIVPDASPDAARVVYCGAQAVVRSRECRSGAIELTGGIQAGAVYLTEADGAPRALTAWLPFTLRLEHPAAKDDTQILMDCRVLAADARLVNSRKILFRAEVGAQIMGFAADRIELPLLKQTPPELQLRCRNYPLPLPAETAEKRFLVSDELTLPAGQPTPETILCVSTVPEITERRIVGSKAVFKGSAEIRILYQATDGSICAVSQTFPFSQYCQLAGDYDEERLRLCMAVTSCDAELPTEGGTMAVSAGLLAQCLVTKTVTLPFCEDAFATHGTLQAEWKEFTFDCQLDRQVQQLALRDTLRGEPLRSVIDSAVFVDFPRTEPVEQGVRVTVPVNVRVLGLDAEGMMQGLSGAARAETELPAECGAVCRASAALRPEGSASPSGDGAELRAALTLDAGFFAQQTLCTLSAGTIDPPAEPEARRPSLVIRAGLDGGPVWDVAKQYGTSVAAICAANGLSGEEIEAGGMLLIPM